MRVPRLERELGIEVYASPSPGFGGKIRQFSEDFIVEEILVDGSRAEVAPPQTLSMGERGRYLVCVLIKRNWDTFLAVKAVAKQLGISLERIRIAGIKDAKALTAQHFSVYGVTPEQVSHIKIRNISVYPLRFSEEKIHSDLLLGNQFKMSIRAITHLSSTIEERAKNVQKELQSLGGLPNFFGHQRFGTVRPITHVVGKFLVRGDLEAAALTFLAQPSEREHPESREARKQLWQTKNFKEALRRFPRQLQHERIMLLHLAKRPGDFAGAFRRLPTKLRQLFVQAYQSSLFNKFLSQRLRRSIPLKEVQTGDLVINLNQNELPTKKFSRVTMSSLPEVRDASRGDKMRLAIPLIGFKQTTSDGVQGEIEREILEIENVAPQDFKVSFMPEISAGGGLRTALTPITNLSMYEPTEDLANPSKRIVSLSFMLHRGSYATILLREFMKPRNLIEAGF